jgi:hypothetical protein
MLSDPSKGGYLSQPATAIPPSFGSTSSCENIPNVCIPRHKSKRKPRPKAELSSIRMLLSKQKRRASQV